MDAVALALSDPTRRRILLMLRQKSVTAGAIAAEFPVSRPAISRHLRVLREANLVVDEALGRERNYRLELRALGELDAFLTELRAKPAWERRFDALATEVHRVRRSKKKHVSVTRSEPRRKKLA